ncbi:MAG: TraR/DksA family transcriptional regulator [Methyloligellaceae bacterium]
MIDIEKYKKALLTRLDELDERLHNIEDELEEPTAKDNEDRATEREGDEVLESLGNAGLLEFRKIQSALRRIKNGTYGICIECGEEISTARLDIVPYAPKCRDCA